MENDTKFLIFAHHKDLLEGIEQAVVKAKVGYIRICGSTPAKTRSSLVDKFQEDDACKVAVLGIKAAGTGLTLTSASTVLFAEMTWVPGDILQAEDRVHRIGQTSSVNIQFLMVHNSIDDIMWEGIQGKLDTVGKVLDGKADSLKFLLVHNSIDDVMWEGIQGKVDTVGKAPDGKADSLKVSSTRTVHLSDKDQRGISDFLCPASPEAGTGPPNVDDRAGPEGAGPPGGSSGADKGVGEKRAAPQQTIDKFFGCQGGEAKRSKANPQGSKANPQGGKAKPKGSKANPQGSKADPQVEVEPGCV
eukprot:gene27613-7250_t